MAIIKRGAPEPINYFLDDKDKIICKDCNKPKTALSIGKDGIKVVCSCNTEISETSND